jgi:hypothetical protein
MSGPDTPSTAGPLLPIWLDAKEIVDRRIGALALQLRRYGDRDLDRIAEAGLAGLSDKGGAVGLMVALREADAATGGAARTKLSAEIVKFRQYLKSDKIVQLLDANPFDVPIGMGETLGKALSTIESSMA